MSQGKYACITPHLQKRCQAKMLCELIKLACSLDIDPKTFKKYRNSTNRSSRDGPNLSTVKEVAQIHFDVLSSNFALTYIDKPFFFNFHLS